MCLALEQYCRYLTRIHFILFYYNESLLVIRHFPFSFTQIGGQHIMISCMLVSHYMFLFHSKWWTTYYDQLYFLSVITCFCFTQSGGQHGDQPYFCWLLHVSLSVSLKVVESVDNMMTSYIYVDHYTFLLLFHSKWWWTT